MIPAIILHRRRTYIVVILALLTTVFILYKSPLVEHRHAIPTTHSTWKAEQPSVDGQASQDVSKLAPAELCSQYTWKPYRASPENPKANRTVYDLFLINDELDWLEVRLNTLHRHVDYFVVVESPKTFSGLEKPLNLKENWDRFAQFHTQIIHHVLTDNLNTTSAWEHEELQRNALLDQVIPFLDGPQKIHTDDVLIVSDIDEIPRPLTVTILRTCIFPKRLTLRSRFYYYSFQWLHRGSEWQHPQATFFTGPSTILPDDLRYSRGGSAISRYTESANLWNAAWHCSSCFSHISTLLHKLASFSHREYNKQEFREKAAIIYKVRNGLDLFDRWFQNYDRVEGNLDVPMYVMKNVTRFGYLLDRDPINANFEDVPLAEAAVIALNDTRQKKGGA